MRKQRDHDQHGEGTATPLDSTPPVPRGGAPLIERDAPAEPRPASALPRAVGHYRVLGRLGRGGMGEVLLAYDEILHRRVALKRLRPDRLQREELRRRFEIEARVTALLQHPSIIPVYQLVSDSESGTFYTMRPVEGMTLAALLVRLRKNLEGAREQWPTARLVRLFLQAANAIAYAHSRGVVHRDLKPSNIMIGPFEEVMVMDWGMAKFLGERTILPDTAVALDFDALNTETASQALVGTPAYMAPEQLRNEITDFRSEVFSLGIILYELLALRLPWKGRTIPARLQAMETLPEDPSLLQPTRGIPAHLGEVVLRALVADPEHRLATVSGFASQVARALEGKASWKRLREGSDRRAWRLAGGRLREEGETLTLHSRDEEGFRYFCTHRLADNVRLEFDLQPSRDTELSIWLNAALGPEHTVEDGYSLSVTPARRRRLSMLRSGRVVAGARSPQFEPRRWAHIAAGREEDHFWLRIDGEEIYGYTDPIPMTGGFLGLAGRSSGAGLRNLRLYSRGADASVSCLAVPNAFFNRQLFEEASAEYESIAASHPGRHEGRLARYRSGLCLIEMARREVDRELRAHLLGEARSVYAAGGALDDSCLGALGRAMVARREGDVSGTYEALADGLARDPEDPHLPAVREWLLGRLHGFAGDERRWLAELLPLALDHCTEGWGRQVVRELAKRTRTTWETPSFLVSRGRFRDADPASGAEARLFFAFWAGRSELIEAVSATLTAGGALRPHHLSDIVFALLELGEVKAARRVLTSHAGVGEEDGSRLLQIARLCNAAVLASEGELEESEECLRGVDPEPFDRAYNSARLWVARGLFAAGESRRALRALNRRGSRDYFAREHLAWFALEGGDRGRAEKELAPLVERGDHLRGRNLANFLHGLCLLAAGRQAEGERTFTALRVFDWPRTWTLGSHFLAGRLGGGDVDAYLRSAFPWERRTLESHRRLAERVLGKAA